MCPPKRIRCPPSHESIGPCYCIFKVDSGLAWLALSVSLQSFLSVVISVGICPDLQSTDTHFDKHER